jgi:hypothetical protein
MTDDQMQSMRDDIAYMKELAVDGQRASSRVGGGILAAAGAVYGATAIAQWAQATGRLALPSNDLTFLWLGATGLFLVLAMLIKVMCRGETNRGPVNRANRIVWIAVGWGIAALMVSFFIASYSTGQWIFMNMLAPVVLTFYGAAWMVNASMVKRPAFAVIAAGCFLAAAGMGFLVNSPNLMLAYAAALLLFAFLPGLILMRRGAVAP